MTNLQERTGTTNEQERTKNNIRNNHTEKMNIRQKYKHQAKNTQTTNKTPLYIRMNKNTLKNIYFAPLFYQFFIKHPQKMTYL